MLESSLLDPAHGLSVILIDYACINYIIAMLLLVSCMCTLNQVYRRIPRVTASFTFGFGWELKVISFKIANKKIKLRI